MLSLITVRAFALALAFGQPQPPSEPYVFVFGSEAVMGGAAVHTGGALRVYGRGFCGGPSCPGVVLRAGSDRHIEHVTVKEDGTFEAVVASADPLGNYVLLATQEVEGQLVRAAAPFSIVPREEEGEEPPAK